MGTRDDLWGTSARATGITEEQWLEYFAPHAQAPHADLAKLAYAKLLELGEKMKGQNLHWWAQGIAIAFEYHTGRRAPAQRCDGTFGASASKTLSGTMDEVADQWAEFALDLGEIAGVPIGEEPRRNATEKWRYWRTELDNGAAVSVNISAKPLAKNGTPKVVLAVDMRNLNSTEQSEEFKAAWKEILADFAKVYSQGR
ncbi:hypothetical protein NQ015_08780 [Corynebacterium sp. 153RC1]|uniref:hypothetical protein n=1 Tax=unclassified Corynebacterium TaxID=2624378 RepID=UPI00211C6370|nr:MULTISPECIES: hypothetical protein [unclassified Corynebacterium]MCQ9370923.1 hypothetical protein [Corynebacterium sp. 35RC1]MCQ9353118.1 hypothetical protein [Corynebacterium sp. 209RC1]MCQ9355322.1 hypothetical protein [Corynebacterium sp. 1222RC1]MCQ9357609.1 hypothetical protein [Corynebacterium sp. 122RC1]MCQ9359219.1 hypothetical protein [Corynebacterium sp. 142RC1]